MGARKAVSGPGLRGLASIARQPTYLAGLGCDLVGWLLALYAVRRLPLFAVQTILAGSLAITSVLGWLLLHTRLRRIDVYAIVVAGIGLVSVGFSAGHQRADPPSGWVRVLLVVGVPVAVVAGASIAQRARAVVGGGIAGALFALSAMCARAVEAHGDFSHILRQPLFYAVLGYGAAAIIVHARALGHGHVGPVTAAMWSVEVVVATAVGFTVLGDKVKAGFAWAAIVGIVLAVAGTTVLANAPTLPRGEPGRPDDDAEAVTTP